MSILGPAGLPTTRDSRRGHVVDSRASRVAWNWERFMRHEGIPSPKIECDQKDKWQIRAVFSREWESNETQAAVARLSPWCL